MARRDIVVVGASAGGFGVLRLLARELPANLPAAVFMVLHTHPQGPASLADVLAHDGPLPAGFPGDGDTIRAGRIYVAPPDHHLVLEERRVRVLHGPKQNRHRPAVDVLFRSAAFAHGPRAIGVVLSGWLSDGAAGLAALKRAGGLAVVHDPHDAAYPDMPQNALAEVVPDHVLPAAEIPALIARLAGQEVEALDPPEPELAIESDADRGIGGMDRMDQIGKRSVFTCPDCHGILWELGDQDALQFRCHVGHGFSAAALAEQQDVKLEDTMWTAVRAMEENARLSRRVGDRLNGGGDDLRAKAQELERHAELLRRMISRPPR